MRTGSQQPSEAADTATTAAILRTLPEPAKTLLAQRIARRDSIIRDLRKALNLVQARRMLECGEHTAYLQNEELMQIAVAQEIKG
jgi:hypothetical protein